ncbi:MAG: hypothetical protein H7124_11750 [Phycisphaerales bacterium]|nr:hypothetical protein [Hyphomonadaceae bacterium]
MTLVFAVSCSDSAPAEPVDAVSRPALDWTDPSGRYGANFERFGWRLRPDHRATSIVELVPERAWRNEAYCALWEGQRILAPIPQAEANAAMERHTRESAISANNTRMDDLEFWHGAVDGISTVEMRFRTDAMFQRWRMFRLSTPTGVILIHFVCGARRPTTPEQQSQLDAIVDTLRFLPEPP